MASLLRASSAMPDAESFIAPTNPETVVLVISNKKSPTSDELAFPSGDTGRSTDPELVV